MKTVVLDCNQLENAEICCLLINEHPSLKDTDADHTFASMVAAKPLLDLLLKTNYRLVWHRAGNYFAVVIRYAKLRLIEITRIGL